jgi:hypothetical protein
MHRRNRAERFPLAATYLRALQAHTSILGRRGSFVFDRRNEFGRKLRARWVIIRSRGLAVNRFFFLMDGARRPAGAQ